MGPLARVQALELARALVARSPAAETEVTIDATADRFVRFAEIGPTQDADRERVDVAVRVRVAREGGVGEARAEVASLEPRALDQAMARALELARGAPVERDALEFGGPVAIEPSEAPSSTREHSFDAKARWIELALVRASAERARAAGLAQTTVVERTLVNSRGRVAQGASARAGFSMTVGGADGSGFAEHLAADASAIDAASVVERALAKARAAARPRTIEPGEYAVLLEPAAVSALVGFMGYQGFGAQEYVERASFLCERLGEQVFSSRLSIEDDARNRFLPGMPFDAEGTPTRRVALVDGGRCVGLVCDRAHGRKLGRESTGHATAQPSSNGPMPRNLMVAAGEAGFDELVASVGRGLWITQLHYVNAIDPRELSLTGVTRHGVFWIEGGRVEGAVRNLRFTDGLLRAFRDVRAVGRDRSAAAAAFEGEVVAPALALDSLRFTSTTDF